jgi:arginase
MRPELVRVPRAFGSGGEAMEAAAAMPLGFDEAATISCVDLDQQTEALAAALPENPVVLGGCCCTHVGAGRGLARRHGRIAVVWVDAHGDLNTPETSPSGNLWGMPFRMLLDGGDVAPGDAALLGARSLDPPEEEYIDRVGLATSAAGLDRVLDGVGGAYVALDCDVFDPSEIACFMPEPNGETIDDVAALLETIRVRVPLLGLGLTGLIDAPGNVSKLRQLSAAAGFER